MKRLLFCATLVALQGCASKPVVHNGFDTTVVLATSNLERRLYETRLLNEGHAEKAKRLLEMDINALLVILHEYDETGDLRDESKDTFEAAKTYRRQHPFTVSPQDEADFPGIVFNADDEIREIVGEKPH